MSEKITALAEKFRTCEITGLKVNSTAEKFIKLHAVVAVVCFLIGVCAAIGLVFTRWEAVHLLSAEYYYRFLTLHGLNMLIFFIIFFEMAVLYFAGPVMLGCRVPAAWLGWLSFVLMLAGTVIVDAMVFYGEGRCFIYILSSS